MLYTTKLKKGRYFLGDVYGLERPIVAIPARSSVFYDDEMMIEVEIAGGASVVYDPDALGLFGIIEWSALGMSEDDFEMYGLEIESDTEVKYSDDFLEIVGVASFTTPREYKLTFASTEAEVMAAMGE